MEQTGNEFKPIVLPKSMVEHVLITAHYQSGHNGFPRMNAAIRCIYTFWVGMKKEYINIVKGVSCVQNTT